jgi:hypothetical protein
MSYLTAEGESQLGFDAAIHAALESETFIDAPVGSTFKARDSWVEITHPRQSPWHITYKVIVEQTGS